MHGRTVVAVAALAAVFLLAGCTAEDVEGIENVRDATNATPTDAANLTATVNSCSTGQGVTICKIETTNRLGGVTQARIELQVLRDGEIVHREVTAERIDAGRDFVSMTFSSRRGEYEVAIRRAG